MSISSRARPCRSSPHQGELLIMEDAPLSFFFSSEADDLDARATIMQKRVYFFFSSGIPQLRSSRHVYLDLEKKKIRGKKIKKLSNG